MASPLEHKLHAAILIGSAFAMALLIPTSTEFDKNHRWSSNKKSKVVYGSIPLSFSIVTSALYFKLHLLRKECESSALLARPLLWFVAHFLIFAGYMASLVIVWVSEPKQLGYDTPRLAMLVAYTTVPLMVNMINHLILLCRAVRPLMPSMVAWCKAQGGVECPHCHHKIGQAKEMAQEGSGEDYSLLRGEDYDEGAARLSEDAAAADRIIDV